MRILRDFQLKIYNLKGEEGAGEPAPFVSEYCPHGFSSILRAGVSLVEVTGMSRGAE